MHVTSFEEYKKIYSESVENPEKFWNEIANEFLWKEPWETTLEWNFSEPKIKWFAGGKLNVTENCLDRYLKNFGDKTAIIFEPNDPTEKSLYISYKELYSEVCKFSNVLLSLGVKKGDRVCIYMPMIPAAAVAMLGCARVGAIHSVVFGGFSSQSLSDRINDCGCSILITADGVMRGDKKIHLKNIADEALKNSPSIKKCIVYNNRNFAIHFESHRDVWWHDVMNEASVEHTAESMDAEDSFFILYTSGSTGKPKGVLHTCGGYMVYAGYTFQNVFQYPQPLSKAEGQENTVFWCTADVGWITGHSYLLYGALLNAATTVMFEGVPTFPDAGRFWEIIEKHKVNIFYTAPTAIRSLMAFGEKFIEGKNLSSLKVLGTVGEPINEEAWEWYNKNIGKDNCPIVDTWWQTETGGILISPLAGITPTIPSWATHPLPGVQLVLMDEKANIIPTFSYSNGEKKYIAAEGNLCLCFPVPGMARTLYGDHERFRKTYFSTYENLYFTGDGARRDENGNYRITGRVDDVINVSGHRIGTGEVEDAINEHPHIIESAVVGFPHDLKGQGIYAFVIADSKTYSSLINYNDKNTSLYNEIKNIVAEKIGPFAKPDKIHVVQGLPKTRSGKIIRRILRKIAEGEKENFGDISTLLDPNVVVEILKNLEVFTSGGNR